MHFQGYLEIFRGIDAYSSRLAGVHLEGRAAGWSKSPWPLLENRKKCSDFGKKTLIVFIFGFNLISNANIQNVAV